MKISTTNATLVLIALGLSSAWKFSSDKEDEPKIGYENTRCAAVSHKTGESRDINFQDEESYYRWERNYTESGARESSRSCCLVLYNSESCDTSNGQKHQRIWETVEAGYTDKWPIKRFTVEGCENVNSSECAPPPNNTPPPKDRPRCFWDTSQRNSARGRCVGSKECQNLGRRECQSRQEVSLMTITEQQSPGKP
jgi:hypothetical protein